MARGLGILVLAAALLTACTEKVDGPGAAGSSSPSVAPPSSSAGPVLRPGPVSYVALGDSLTEGNGDDNGTGFVGHVAAAIAEKRPGSTVENFGHSGWTSTGMVDGQDGSPAELAAAVAKVRAATSGGGAALATVLIGSNDLTLLYQNAPGEGTSAELEAAALATYRTNLDRAVSELQGAGAFVVVGLPDDQTLRPGFADIARLNQFMDAITAAEVMQMSSLAKRFAATAAEVAAARAAPTVDTNAPFWASAATMAEDGIHPNAAGYRAFAELWLRVIRPSL